MARNHSREGTPATPDHPAVTAIRPADGALDGLATSTSAELLGLAVRYPAPGVCVVVVDGEVDMLTAPLLEARIHEQLAAAPHHLILDLEPVRFLSSSGLSCLLRARELVQQTAGVHLHLTGLATRAVARPLKALGVQEYFSTYPSLTDALAYLTDSTEMTISTQQVTLLSIDGRLDEMGLTQLRKRLQRLIDTDARCVVLNLAGVTSCDRELLDVLAGTHQILTQRRGWMRLVGVGPAVRNALDEATPSHWPLIDQASDWTNTLAG